MTQNQPQKPQASNTLLELVFNIVVPSLILMKLSSDEYLGTVNALIIALAFPLLYGIWDFVKSRSLNFFSLLGFLSTLLTGGIGLFELDPQWLAIKEAAIPAVIGFVVLMSSFGHKPLIAKLILNPAIFDLEKIYDTLAKNNKVDVFKAEINRANLWLAGTFVFSATANYVLARMIVTSPAGTVAFNEELGKMTMLSYPVIAIPSLLMLIGLLVYVVKIITKLTELKFEDIVQQE
ncbi:MFS transporter [Psychrosphaera sp. B3R10]|uniref:MFS transporter n=1 Tax=Psychrosphaera algicola TaxID=3023714 RepID=A0ABT5FHY5_9GAMM|nr:MULTISPECIES: VC0807 family protein [unclassified Psychrosphaera]MBU2880707.1 MFS transporter [Psychrosphaera sp. I2R16]MBU2991547.1 MFS transporter [Psychrosphaera sp. B3R10]MDC2890793.1 MFS transporter [Psychrosphaera sp. G1-22]MDO6719439.1 VC0807 family protein [Psychrosphaera sp. 1_MG-2023]